MEVFERRMGGGDESRQGEFEPQILAFCCEH